MTETKIQIYKTAKDNVGSNTTVDSAIDIIANQKIKNKIDPLRKLVKGIQELKDQLSAKTDKDSKTELTKKIKAIQAEVDETKKALPAVTWSGTFVPAIVMKADKQKDFLKGKITWSDVHKSKAYFERTRSMDQLDTYSNLICIDIDKLEADHLAELKAFLKADKYTFLVFTSPSGTGLKVIVRVSGGPENHLQNFVGLEKYYQDTYQLKIDPSGKDVSRLCFLSADNDFQGNYGSQIFSAVEFAAVAKPAAIQPEIPEIKPLTKGEAKQFQAAADTLDWVREFTDKKSTYADGNRNNYLFLFACNANRKGFDISDTLTYCCNLFSDLDIKEISSTIQKAYNYNVQEHGKYRHSSVPGKAKNNRSNNATPGNSYNGRKPGADPGSSGTDPITANDDSPLFWREHTIEKGKGEQKYTVKRLELYRVAFMQFLERQGFFIYETGREGYQVCQNSNGVIRTVDPRKIKNHVYQWCKNQDDRQLYVQVEEMLRKGQKNYFAYTDLESLSVCTPNFLKDTKDEAYFFFQNCYVKITADSITTHQLQDVQKAIWDTSIIKRDFTLKPINLEGLQDTDGFLKVNRTDSDIVKFILQVSTNPDKLSEVGPEVAGERFFSICSSIGYMLHGYKDPIAKAVLAVDHKIPADKSEQNGGTGKSIIGKSFKYLKGVTELDGKDFKEDYQFRYEAIDIDTKIVVMADCRYNLEFAGFFNAITSDFRFNKRHTGYITIPFEDAPKWWFDTNFVFKGEGSSYRRRQHIIEFDDYYSDDYTPQNFFQHLLFNDWDADQWNMFYNFYFQCVQIYLQKGLIPYQGSNYDNRKLMVESNTEFIDWLDGHDDKGVYRIKRNAWIAKKELLKAWNDEAKSLNMQTISPHSFSKWVKRYCTTKGFKFDSKKSNSVEYYMIAEKDFNPVNAAVIIDLFNQN